MRKIDLILENIRDEYMINLLEEGEVTELQTLKTKKFLNESLRAIRGMLVEEGTMDNVKDHLKNNWGKYLAGAGAAGLAGAGYEYKNEIADALGMGDDKLPVGTGEALNPKVIPAGGPTVEKTPLTFPQTVAPVTDVAGENARMLQNAADNGPTATDNIMANIKNGVSDAGTFARNLTQDVPEPYSAEKLSNGLAMDSYLRTADGTPTEGYGATDPDVARGEAAQAIADQNMQNIINQQAQQGSVGQQITPNDLAGHQGTTGGTFTDRTIGQNQSAINTMPEPGSLPDTNLGRTGAPFNSAYLNSRIGS